MKPKTDIQFLKLAAKAAGFTVQRSRLNDPMWRDLLLDKPASDGQTVTAWNPLVNDGDAFRLAIALELTIAVCRDASQPRPWLWIKKVRAVLVFVGPEEYALDPAAATRRAIVEAAAQIGAVQ